MLPDTEQIDPTKTPLENMADDITEGTQGLDKSIHSTPSNILTKLVQHSTIVQIFCSYYPEVGSHSRFDRSLSENILAMSVPAEKLEIRNVCKMSAPD